MKNYQKPLINTYFVEVERGFAETPQGSGAPALPGEFEGPTTDLGDE